MSIPDQYFVFHPEPWQDRDWARLSGLRVERLLDVSVLLRLHVASTTIEACYPVR